MFNCSRWLMLYTSEVKCKSKQTISIVLCNAKLISKVLRYDPCVARDHTVLPATHTHKLYLPLLPSRKASPPFGRYQLVLLGEQRHIGVRNLPWVSTQHARLRLERTTSWSQVRYSTDSATMPLVISLFGAELFCTVLCSAVVHSNTHTSVSSRYRWYKPCWCRLRIRFRFSGVYVFITVAGLFDLRPVAPTTVKCVS